MRKTFKLSLFLEENRLNLLLLQRVKSMLNQVVGLQVFLTSLLDLLFDLLVLLVKLQVKLSVLVSRLSRHLDF